MALVRSGVVRDADASQSFSLAKAYVIREFYPEGAVRVVVTHAAVVAYLHRRQWLRRSETPVTSTPAISRLAGHSQPANAQDDIPGTDALDSARAPGMSPRATRAEWAVAPPDRRPVPEGPTPSGGVNVSGGPIIDPLVRIGGPTYASLGQLESYAAMLGLKQPPPQDRHTGSILADRVRSLLRCAGPDTPTRKPTTRRRHPTGQDISHPGHRQHRIPTHLRDRAVPPLQQ